MLMASGKREMKLPAMLIDDRMMQKYRMMTYSLLSMVMEVMVVPLPKRTCCGDHAYRPIAYQLKMDSFPMSIPGNPGCSPSSRWQIGLRVLQIRRRDPENVLHEYAAGNLLVFSMLLWERSWP
jgi:hypothetical protein